MGKWSPCKRRDFIRKLKKSGFDRPEPSGNHHYSNTNWDLIIRLKSGWFDLHLSDLWRCRDLTMLFVWRDFVAQYKQSILGSLWYLIQPS
jgi:hypothetical protein